MAYFEPFSAEQLENYYKEWNMTPESLKKDAQYLMEWLEKQPHLPSIKDEKLIIATIQKCKNRLEKAKEALELVFTLRAIIPELRDGIDVAEKELRILVEMGLVAIPLPKLTSEGHRVYVFQPSKNASKYSLNADVILKMGSALSSVIHQEQNNGIIFIVELNGLTAAHIASTTSILKTFSSVMRSIPRRLIVFYIMNLSPLTNALLTMAKVLMKHKISERIISWTGAPQDLANEIPKDVLPTEFGGNAGSFEEIRGKYWEYILSQRELIQEVSKQRADLTKKPPDSRICDELLDFGIDGSFRTLSIE